MGWSDLLGQATTGSQFHGIASAVLDHDDGAVARLHQFLVAAADWYDERGEKNTSRRYEVLADRFDALADEMVQLTRDLARTAHHRTAAPSPTRPPTPPGACKPPRR